MAGEWFCEIGGRAIGPLTSQQLRAMAASGQIVPTDRVRRGDSGGWVTANHVKGLFAAAQTDQQKPSPQSKPQVDVHPPVRLESEPTGKGDADSEEYALLDVPPEPPVRRIKFSTLDDDKPADSDDSDEYQLAPLPADLMPKSPAPRPAMAQGIVASPQSPAPAPPEGGPSEHKRKRSKPFAPGAIQRPPPPRDLGVRQGNSLLDSGMESLSEETIAQAAVGSPILASQARRQRQQQQRLFIALAVIGIGMGMAVFVLLFGLDRATTESDGRTTNKAKSVNPVRTPPPVAQPQVPAPEKTERAPEPATDTNAPVKKADKKADEAVPMPTGNPETDFGIPAEDAPSTDLPNKPDKKL